MKEVLVSAGPWVVAFILAAFQILFFAVFLTSLRLLESYKMKLQALTGKFESRISESFSSVAYAFGRINEQNAEIRRLNRGNKRLSSMRRSTVDFFLTKEEALSLRAALEAHEGEVRLTWFDKGRYIDGDLKNKAPVTLAVIGGESMFLSNKEMVPRKKKPAPEPVQGLRWVV